MLNLHREFLKYLTSSHLWSVRVIGLMTVHNPPPRLPVIYRHVSLTEVKSCPLFI